MRAPPFRRTLVTTLLVAIAALVACVASIPPNGGAQASPTAAIAEHVAGVLAVDNAQFPDVDVYILRDGTTVRRLGEVSGFNRKAFVLRSSDVVSGASLSFAAHSLGSRNRFDYRSAGATAREGTLYEWTLGVAGPGTDFLSERQAAEYSNPDADPPNRLYRMVELRR